MKTVYFKSVADFANYLHKRYTLIYAHYKFNTLVCREAEITCIGHPCKCNDFNTDSFRVKPKGQQPEDVVYVCCYECWSKASRSERID